MSSSFYNLAIPTQSSYDFDTIVALLDTYTDFDSVWEREDSIEIAYRRDSQPIESLVQVLKELNIIKYTIADIADTNWNEVFEKSYEPLTILDGKWHVRATFHPLSEALHEIIIDPKMSFGTGHHATTRSMMTLIDALDLTDRLVMDYGSGTGILAIMAALKGAQKVWANDNEEWAYKNSIENAQINQVADLITFFYGTLHQAVEHSAIPDDHKFDVIFANITKNILLDSVDLIDRFATKHNHLLLSGFYTHDAEDIINSYSAIGYRLHDQIIDSEWTALHLIRTKS